MDKEKMVVILLLITIILSIGSIVVTYSLNSQGFNEVELNEAPVKNSGNVNLEIIEPPTGGESS